MNKRFALITGGAQRIGKAIAETLHQNGFDILLHYGSNQTAAESLAQALNIQRENSCHVLSADLSSGQYDDLIQWVHSHTDSLHALVNNASQFYPTPWENASNEQWQQLFTVNTQAPFFITQGLLPLLKKVNGSVINLIDIHAERTLEDHPIYSATKAALKSLTLSLAKDYGKTIRCNGISPGAILWPDNDGELSENAKQEILDKVPMQRLGDVKNIAQTALFLVENSYINGQIINVDGGRTVYS
jgi:pteridine reductase